MKPKPEKPKLVDRLFPRLYSERRRRKLTRWKSFWVRMNPWKRKLIDWNNK